MEISVFYDIFELMSDEKSHLEFMDDDELAHLEEKSKNLLKFFSAVKSLRVFPYFDFFLFATFKTATVRVDSILSQHINEEFKLLQPTKELFSTLKWASLASFFPQ